MVELKFSVRGIKEMRDALAQYPELAIEANLEGMKASVEMLKKQMASRMPIGPGRFGTHLADSFQTKIEPNFRSIVGSTYSLMPEGKWLEAGTKAHDIGTAKRSLVIDGQFAGMKVHHPGQKARHIAKIVLQVDRPFITAFFRAAYANAIKKIKAAAAHG